MDSNEIGIMINQAIKTIYGEIKKNGKLNKIKETRNWHHCFDKAQQYLITLMSSESRKSLEHYARQRFISDIKSLGYKTVNSNSIKDEWSECISRSYRLIHSASNKKETNRFLTHKVSLLRKQYNVFRTRKRRHYKIRRNFDESIRISLFLIRQNCKRNLNVWDKFLISKKSNLENRRKMYEKSKDYKVSSSRNERFERNFGTAKI